MFDPVSNILGNTKKPKRDLWRKNAGVSHMVMPTTVRANITPTKKDFDRVSQGKTKVTEVAVPKSLPTTTTTNILSKGVSQTANPSAVFAVKQGLKYNTVTDAKGNQSGVVTLPTGAKMDAWQYYRENYKPTPIKMPPVKSGARVVGIGGKTFVSKKDII